MEDVPVEKIKDHEKPVPTAWRPALKQLVDKIALGAESKALSNIEIGLIVAKLNQVTTIILTVIPINLVPFTNKLGKRRSISGTHLIGECW